MQDKIITKGGFEVINFKKLKKSIPKGNILEPHIYEGYIINFQYDENTIIKKHYCTWDKFGRCSNWNRKDCFINIKTLKTNEI